MIIQKIMCFFKGHVYSEWKEESVFLCDGTVGDWRLCSRCLHIEDRF